MKRATSILIVILLAGCQTTPDSGPALEEANLSGATLVLLQPLEIPRRRTNVVIQQGEIRRHLRIDRYHPSCAFVLRGRSGEPRVVEPDEFTVTRVRRESRSVSGPSVFGYSTHLDLHSPRQPDVSMMTCDQWNILPDTEHVTVEEMRLTLRGFFTLRLPGK